MIDNRGLPWSVYNSFLMSNGTPSSQPENEGLASKLLSVIDSFKRSLLG